MQLYNLIERRIVLPGDSETLRSQKALSITLVIGGSLMTMINVLSYLSLGSTAAALSYFGLILFNIIAVFVIFRNPRLWLPFGYMVIVATIFFNMFAHFFAGGYQSGLVAAVWMMLGPIICSLFFPIRFTLVALVIYSLAIITIAFLEPIAQALAPEMSLTERMRIAVANMILMGIFITAATLYLLRQVDYYRHRADELIQNMLPGAIAARLKASKETIADAYDEVTVLFADMVGSTPLFAGLEPAEAVDWLNEVFLMFDDLVEKYSLEKIRTIGDNYMVASGVPSPREDHAQAMAAFALDMQRGLQKIPARNGQKMAFRVGINTGPLVAGVIGRSKYQYDLWGDSVNLASRMESTGEPGKVHISPTTYALVKDAFTCVSRGQIAIKGKGEMETWFLLHHNTNTAEGQNK
jgi:adenylate cyclase